MTIEHPAPGGLPPMDAAWWQAYRDLYREIFAIYHRLINLDTPLFEPEEVMHLGEFMGMTSRIQATHGQEKEPLR